jgi:hypothetical protein
MVRKVVGGNTNNFSSTYFLYNVLYSFSTPVEKSKVHFYKISI